MENGENILDAIYEEDNLDDVEMIYAEEGELDEPRNSQKVDIEEGELVLKQHDSQNVSGQNGAVEADNKKPYSKNRRRRANKRNKRKGLGTGVFDINRFVLDTCRHLKEKKSYMVYTAVGCLGVSPLSDLIKEVEAIQTCGGQKTAYGRRFRTGGGVLWSIVKVREPNAYKEIMKKAKEFEKQFKQPSVKHPPVQKKEDSSQGKAITFPSEHQDNVSDNPLPALQMQDQHGPSGSEEKRNSIYDRLRIPVIYDDDLLGLSLDNDATSS